jgi:hypothetical protein
MADQTYNVNWSAKVSQLGMPALWRLAIWGGLATFALLAAAISGYSNAGSHRQAPSGQIASAQASAGPASAQPRIPGETAEETRRLAETVRALAADRDQVLARIAVLERNLDGVTGTIKRDRVAGPQPAATPPPPNPSPAASAVPVVRPEAPVARAEPQAARAETLVARTETPVMRPEAPAARPEAPVARTETPTAPVKEAAVTLAPAPAAAAQPSEAEDAAPTVPDSGNRTMASASNPGRVSAPAEPLAVAAGLGIDVGSAGNYEGLRTIWKSTKTSEAELPAEAYPVVTVRENGKTHGAELRLVVGPIADVELASRLCGTLSAAHHYCQPVAFEGQRLSMIDSAPATKTVPTPPAKADRTSKASSSHHTSEPPPPTPLQRLRAFNWK